MGWFNHQLESVNPSMKICDPVHCSAGFWHEGIWFWGRRVICLNLWTIWQMPFCILEISCPLGAPCVINCFRNLHSFSLLFFMNIAYLGLPKKYSKTYNTWCFVLQLQTRKLPGTTGFGMRCMILVLQRREVHDNKVVSLDWWMQLQQQAGWKRWWEMFPRRLGISFYGDNMWMHIPIPPKFEIDTKNWRF